MKKNFIFVGIFLLGLVSGFTLPFRFLDVQEFRERVEMTAHIILLEIKEVWLDDSRVRGVLKVKVGETGKEECDS